VLNQVLIEFIAVCFSHQTSASPISRYSLINLISGEHSRHQGPHIVSRLGTSGRQSKAARHSPTTTTVAPTWFPAQPIRDSHITTHQFVQHYDISPSIKFCALSSSVRIHPCSHATDVRIAPLTTGYSSSEATNLLAARWTASLLGPDVRFVCGRELRCESGGKR
jgi:hypothetical protein